MRILIATGIYPPDVGGPATHSKKLAEEFSKMGWEVRIISYGNPSDLRVVGISRKIPFGLRHLFYFLTCLRLAMKSDLIFAQDAAAAGLPALLAAKILGKKFFVRIGGDLLWERVAGKGKTVLSFTEYYRNSQYLADRPALFRLIRYVLRGAEKVIVVAPFLKEVYEKYYGVPGEKIKVILNPVELGNFSTNFSGEGDPVILFTGRFVAYKNLKFLLRVFDGVRQKISRGRLILTGDGPEKEELIKFSKSLLSTAYIKILPSLSREKLLEKIKEAAVCVGPSFTEFNPNFILECLSAGKPSLLSNENGLSVRLPDEFLFDPKNEQELEEKIIKLLQPEGFRREVSAFSILPPGPNWQKVVEEYLKLFK